MNTMRSDSSSLNAKVTKFIEDARNKLVDSGTRNRLVHVNRQGRGKFLNIVNERSKDIFRILYSEKKKMKFRATEKLLKFEDDDEIHFEEVDLATATDIGEVDESGFIDRYLDIKLDIDSLQKRLLLMARGARTEEEEKGINVLFLALGFLSWYEDDNSKIEREAPLILIPVDLIRNERTSTYDIRTREEDILTNLSLQARLQEDFGLGLPEIEIDENWKPSDYFENVTRVVSSKRRWKVEANGILLGFFSFAKQLMLRDLEQDNWTEDKLCNDELIQNLLVSGFEPDTPIFGDKEPIDNRLPPESIIQVVEADYPQTKVIEEVRSGRNLVVQGPPGTGKSQTITNIIAAATHDGKTVLFMAEKMAALDVVHNRLKKCQLGNLCLELHSRHANKKEILQELGRTLKSAEETTASEISTNELKAVRDELNHLDNLLHTTITDTTFTAFEAMAGIVKYMGKNCPPPRISSKGLAKLNNEQQNEIEQAIDTVANVYSKGRTRMEHPFAGLRNTNMDPVDQERMWENLKGLLRRIDMVMEIGEELSQKISLYDEGQHGKKENVFTFNSLADFKKFAAFIQVLRLRPEQTALVRDCIFGKHESNSIIEALNAGVEWSSARQQASSKFHQHAWDTPAQVLVANLSPGASGGISSFIARLGSRYRRACSALDNITVLPLPKDPIIRLELAKELKDVEDKRKALSQEEEFLKEQLSSVWRGERTAYSSLHEAALWVKQAEATGIPRSAKELENIETDILALSEYDSEIDSAVDIAVRTFQKTIDQIEFSLVEANLGADISCIKLGNMRETIQEMLQQGSMGYLEWNNLQAAVSTLTSMGLSDLITLMDDKVLEPRSAIEEFGYALAESRWKRAIRALPELRQIGKTDRHKLVQSFVALDKKHCNDVQMSIKSCHLENLPKGAAGEMNIIRGEIAKKRRHLSIRNLISKAGTMIQRIKPVFLMSPISIAQFLPPKSLRFDMLVIDEASQVRPEDAIGAIARCDQIVVVGDQKQLPPTSFFSRLESDFDIEDEDDNDDAIGVAKVTEMESILTLCEARGISQRMLEWHYRSRDPSLIRISNKRFYYDKLILPSSPKRSEDAYGMFFTKVSGVYASKGSAVGRPGTNKIEAERIVSEVAEHARENPNLSLGIVTFSRSQANMVAEILERDRRIDKILNDFLREGRIEDLFVKNIENVQGDERDVIFVSVGYGPSTANAKLTSMLFGPINREGGERRLNVLFTRARFICRIFASFDPEDIDPTRVKRLGPKILQEYMQYARTRQVDNIQSSNGQAESPFEEDVANVIHSLGYRADHQVGDSGFRIDLGVRHPDKPGRYMLAVECDGATYHSALSARERDRHRQSVLELMGWNFYRIWSTDWFHGRDHEIDRLKFALDDAKNREDQIVFSGTNLNVHIQDSETVEYDAVDGGAELQVTQNFPEIFVPEYEEAKLVKQRDLEPHSVPIPDLAILAMKIVEQEGPVHFDIIARRIVETFGKRRTGTRIQQSASGGLKHAKKYSNGYLLQQGKYWITQTQMDNVPVRNRVNASGLVIKSEMLPPIEILAAAQLIRKECGHVEKEELMREVSQLLGFRRTGSDLKEKIGRILRQKIAA